MDRSYVPLPEFHGDGYFGKNENNFKYKLSNADVQDKRLQDGSELKQFLNSVLTNEDYCRFLNLLLGLMKENEITCGDGRYVCDGIYKHDNTSYEPFQVCVKLNCLRLGKVLVKTETIVPFKDLSCVTENQNPTCLNICFNHVNDVPKIAVVFAINAIGAILRHGRLFLPNSSSLSKSLKIDLVLSDKDANNHSIIQQKKDFIINKINELLEIKNAKRHERVSLNRPEKRVREDANVQLAIEFKQTEKFFIHKGVTPLSTERIRKWIDSGDCPPLSPECIDCKIIRPEDTQFEKRIFLQKDPGLQCSQEVMNILEDLNLTKYSHLFAENEIDFTGLLALQDNDLVTLGLPMGPRAKIRQAVEHIKSNTPTVSGLDRCLPMDSEKIPTSELRSSMENLRPYVEPQAEQEELAMDVDHTPTLPGERKEGWKGKGKGKTSMPPPKHSIYTGEAQTRPSESAQNDRKSFVNAIRNFFRSRQSAASSTQQDADSSGAASWIAELDGTWKRVQDNQTVKCSKQGNRLQCKWETQLIEEFEIHLAHEKTLRGFTHRNICGVYTKEEGLIIWNTGNRWIKKGSQAYRKHELMEEFKSTVFNDEGVARRSLEWAGWNLDRANAAFQTIPKDRLPRKENEENSAVASTSGSQIDSINRTSKIAKTKVTNVPQIPPTSSKPTPVHTPPATARSASVPAVTTVSASSQHPPKTASSSHRPAALPSTYGTSAVSLLSDQNCSCPDQYKVGFSSGFQQNTHSNSTVTDSDDLLTVFNKKNFPIEHQIIQDMNNGTAITYGDICNGSRKNLLVLPHEIFEYGRGEASATIHIQAALEKIKELDEQMEQDSHPISNISYLFNPMSQMEEDQQNLIEFEKSYIQNHFEGLVTEHAERAIKEMLIEIFHDEIGFLVHSYEPETYLKPITERAWAQRKSMLDLMKFTGLEDQLMDVLGIRQLVNQEANDIISELQKQRPNSSTFTGNVLETAIKSRQIQIHKQKKVRISNTLLKKRTYDIQESIRVVAIGLIHYYSNQSGKNNFLLCLLEYKLLINLEVKYEVKKDKNKQDQAKHLLCSSSKQTSEHDHYYTRTHAPIFGKQWQFLKVCVILPGDAIDSTLVCPTCDTVVITARTLKDKQSRFSWFKQLGITKQYKHVHVPGAPLGPDYMEYLTFLKRIVGGMHSTTYDQSSWKKVMGTKHVSSFNPGGYTESQPTSAEWEFVKDSTTGKCTKRKPKTGVVSKPNKNIDHFWDSEMRPMDAENTIYLTGQQMSLLSNSSLLILNTILIGDYGAGKSVLIKKKAIKTKEDLMAQGKPDEVYFIPVTSCDEFGRPIDPTALFDQFSKKHMLKHNVIVMTAQDLWNDYEKTNIGWDGLTDFFPTSTNFSKDQKNRRIFEDSSKKAIAGEMSAAEFQDIMKKNGINAYNAGKEVIRRMRNPTIEANNIDIYNLLCWFVQQKRRTKRPFHLFLDEFPVLRSTSTFSYDEHSLSRMFDFLKAIKEEMLVGTHIWVSMQTNVIKDFASGYSDNWEQLVGEFKSNLKQDNWHLPVLTKNLRNSAQVFDLVENIKTDDYGDTSLKDTLGFKIMGMTLNATLPKHIPINSDEQDKYLVDAILLAIQQTKEELKMERASFVILHDDLFKTKEIYNDLKKRLGPNEIVLQYPKNKQEEKNPTIDYIETFMKSGQHGCLVIRDRAYSGAEAENVVLTFSSDGGSLAGLRGNLMRCIANLSVIELIGEGVQFNFENVRQFNNFLKCKKQCETFIHQCITCQPNTKPRQGEQSNLGLLCVCCRLICHQGHSFKQVYVKGDLKSQDLVHCGCECNK